MERRASFLLLLAGRLAMRKCLNGTISVTDLARNSTVHQQPPDPLVARTSLADLDCTEAITPKECIRKPAAARYYSTDGSPPTSR
jgi:hypothetical protein